MSRIIEPHNVLNSLPLIGRKSHRGRFLNQEPEKGRYTNPRWRPAMKQEIYSAFNNIRDWRGLLGNCMFEEG